MIKPIFNYKSMRLMLGIIALAMPFLVTFIAQADLISISSSYHTVARDYFVGLLFVAGAMMFVYNGHSMKESIVSKVAGLCAILIAVFPTAAGGCASPESSFVHGAASILFFLILTYFCFGPFRDNTKGQVGKSGKRAKLYAICGSIMGGCLIAAVITNFTLSCEVINDLRIIYWVEGIALSAFGVAWIVSGKVIPQLTDETEKP